MGLDRKLGEMMQASTDVTTLMQDAEFQDLRMRLVEKFETLLRRHYDFAAERGVEIALWRSGFYLVIEAARKQLRKSDSEVLRSLLASHLLEAQGFYWQLLECLSSPHFDVALTKVPACVRATQKLQNLLP